MMNIGRGPGGSDGCAGSDSKNRQLIGTSRARLGLAAVVMAASAVLAVPAFTATSFGSLQSQIDEKRSQLNSNKEREGIMASDLAKLSRRVRALQGQVAALQARVDEVQAQYEQAKDDYERERRNYLRLKRKLKLAMEVLAQHIQASFESNKVDEVTFVLGSKSWSEFVGRVQDMKKIGDKDVEITETVMRLKQESARKKRQLKALKERIGAKLVELQNTKSQLEARTAVLESAQASRQSALDRVRSKSEELEGDVSAMEDQIQKKLREASTASASPTGLSLPAGPVKQGSGNFIWPVNGPVSSGFGQRWGRLHAGIDISAPGGTPIRAADSGSVVLASPTSGYGNYICVQHGGSIQTCYAHLSSYATSAGASVSQGDVIGNVGCTGHCYGDHLHFEVRINGSPVDPLGYL